MASTDRVPAAGAEEIAAVAPPSPQATSAGTISVAMLPGAEPAATIASTASRPRFDAAFEVRNHLE
jgi:hypothetical protein